MRRIIGSLVTAALAACAAVTLCPASWAGDPTKNEQFQPGAEGARLIDAAAFESLQAAFQAPVSYTHLTLPTIYPV